VPYVLELLVDRLLLQPQLVLLERRNVELDVVGLVEQVLQELHELLDVGLDVAGRSHEVLQELLESRLLVDLNGPLQVRKAVDVAEVEVVVHDYDARFGGASEFANALADEGQQLEGETVLLRED
jgi:hypothetical protein